VNGYIITFGTMFVIVLVAIVFGAIVGLTVKVKSSKKKEDSNFIDDFKKAMDSI